MKTKGIFLSWIVVDDIEKSMHFYTQVMGFKLKEFNQEFGWAEVAGPEGSTLGLAQSNLEQGVKTGTNAVITVSVENIEEARDQLIQQGIRLIGDMMIIPGVVKLQSFLDLDGNMLQLAQEYLQNP